MPSRKRRSSNRGGRRPSKRAHAETRDTQFDQELSNSSNLQVTVSGSKVNIQLEYVHRAARSNLSPTTGADDDTDGEIDQDVSVSDVEDDSENDDGYPVELEFSWLERMSVKGNLMTGRRASGTPETVAYCKAYMIRRNRIRHDFYEEIEQPTRESSMLGLSLFDRYGRLRPEFKTHPFIRGTGVWDQELDRGDMLLIEEVFVNREFRRQGVGRRMLESLLQLAQNKSRSFLAFVWPTILKLDDIEQDWDSLGNNAARDDMAHREQSRAMTFFRSLGFRRVGSTIWFALTSNSEHPSRQLDATEDFDPPEAPVTSLHPLLATFQQTRDPPSDDLDSIRNPQSYEPPDHLETLRNFMLKTGPTDPCWTSKDKNGNTVLHLAASMLDVACVKWIVEQDFGLQLLGLRNNKGETPLELFQFKLERLRTQNVAGELTSSVSDLFRGHGEDAVRCLILLKGLGSIESLVELQGGEALLRIDRGCTCGQCLAGFLSARMSNAFLVQAELGYDIMKETVDDLSGPEWVEQEEEFLVYLRSSVRENLKTNKSMRRGFTNLREHAATCLRRGLVPTASNILDIAHSAKEWPTAVSIFLQGGGTVESVVLAICKRAMEQDEWIGDGQYQEVFSKDIASLPECRNDLEFGFVCGMCGYRRISLTRHTDMWGNLIDEHGNRLDSLW